MPMRRPDDRGAVVLTRPNGARAEHEYDPAGQPSLDQVLAMVDLMPLPDDIDIEVVEPRASQAPPPPPPT